MKSKKFISMVFALFMALTLALPAFAESDPDMGNSVFKADATTVLPTINVDLTSLSAPVILNPLELVGEAPDPDDPVPEKALGTVEPTYLYVENKTLTDLKVSANVIGSYAGGARFNSSPLTGTETAKKAFVYGVFLKQDDDDGFAQPDYDASASNQVVIKSGTVKKTDVVSLPAASEDEPNYLAFGLFGSCAAKLSYKKWWAESDTLSVTVVYSFKMVPVGST